MSYSTQVSQTPTKKKRGHLKQRNILGHYFRAQRKSSECKTQENISVLNAKRNIQSTDKDDVKFLKINPYDCNVLLNRIPITENSCNGINLPKVTAAVSVNHVKEGVCKTESKRSDADLVRKENKSSDGKIQCHKDRIVPKNITKKMSVVENENGDIEMQSSVNDSIDIEAIGTPNQPKISKISKYEHCFSLPMEETEKNTEVCNELSKINETDERMCTTSQYQSHKSQLLPQERKKISASSFREIICSFCQNDFLKPYRKLSYSKPPECCDLEKCKTVHEGVRLKEVNSFQYGHVFNILDNPLPEWMCDISANISLVVTKDQYLRGDMLRIIFDYILNGPNEDLMWDMKTILETHWSLHPPCTVHMRKSYLELLHRRYPHESFFETNLANSGVLLHVMDQMEKVLKSEKDVKEVCETEDKTNEDAENVNSSQSKLTFEVLEERYNNLQPLFEEEHQEVMDTLDDMANLSQQEKSLIVLDKSEVLNRLTIALEVIIDLLEADFVICISRLKSNIKKGECEHWKPLIADIVDDSFHSRVFNLYVKTSNTHTWQQLSRLIGLMAETVHLFRYEVKMIWKYPKLFPECEEFASFAFEEFSKGDWNERECLSRLRTLRPPWLQQRVTLAVANSHLNLDLGSSIEAVVDIIHTHVVSPVKLAENLKKVEPDPDKLKQMSEKLMKRSKKKNHYGETLLHQLCRNKRGKVEDIECLLALPDTDVNAKDNHGWTPLHEAVASMSLAKTELLLQFKPPAGKPHVDVGAQNNDGTTPLHDAVKGNNLDICKLLVQYGGICLLRKKDNAGVTPLIISKNKEEIRSYFEKVIKIQEELNLNCNSVLKLADPIIRMCMVVCEAFIDDHHTWELYQVLKFDKEYNKVEAQPWVTSSKELQEFKHDQDQFRKLRRILEKLAENPENSYLIRLWNDRFLYRETNR